MLRQKKAAPTETRTQAKGFKVLCADHYTIGAQLLFIVNNSSLTPSMFAAAVIGPAPNLFQKFKNVDTDAKTNSDMTE